MKKQLALGLLLGLLAPLLGAQPLPGSEEAAAASALPAVSAMRQEAFLSEVSAGRKAKMAGFNVLLQGAFSQQTLKQARLLDAQALAKQEEEKASGALKALMTAYPEYTTLLAKVAQRHNNLVRVAAEQENEQKLVEMLNVQMDYLHSDLALLLQKNEEVGGQVQQILQHEYWVAAHHETMEWTKIQQLACQSVNSGPAASPGAPSWCHKE